MKVLIIPLFDNCIHHRKPGDAALSDLHLAIDLDENDDYLVPIKTRISHMAVVDTLAIGLAVRCKPAYLERLRQANLSLDDKFEVKKLQL